MKENAENYRKLPDDLRLCYAEYGDPTGQPLFVFHSNPNSRLIGGLMSGSFF